MDRRAFILVTVCVAAIAIFGSAVLADGRLPWSSRTVVELADPGGWISEVDFDGQTAVWIEVGLERRQPRPVRLVTQRLDGPEPHTYALPPWPIDEHEPLRWLTGGPRVSGDNVFFAGNPEGDGSTYAVYRFHLPSETLTILVAHGGPMRDVAVHGQTIVWSDARRGEYSIWGYDLASGAETRLVQSPTGNQRMPAISADWLVWLDEGVDGTLLNARRRPGGEVLTLSPRAWDVAPALEGSRVVWYELEGGAGVNAHLYDLELEEGRRFASVQPDCPVPIDVVLIVDSSTSMLGSGPGGGGVIRFYAAKEALLLFVEQLRLPPDQAALSIFSDEATLLAPLGSDREYLSRAIGAIVTRPGSRMDLGLQLATQELASPRRRAENMPAAVLLSDGRPTVPNQIVVQAAAAMKALGVTLYTIGIGDEVDTDLLRAVASRPEAFLHVQDLGHLTQVLLSVRYELGLCQPPVVGGVALSPDWIIRSLPASDGSPGHLVAHDARAALGFDNRSQRLTEWSVVQTTSAAVRPAIEGIHTFWAEPDAGDRLHENDRRMMRLDLLPWRMKLYLPHLGRP